MAGVSAFAIGTWRFCRFGKSCFGDLRMVWQMPRSGRFVASSCDGGSDVEIASTSRNAPLKCGSPPRIPV